MKILAVCVFVTTIFGTSLSMDFQKYLDCLEAGPLRDVCEEPTPSCWPFATSEEERARDALLLFLYEHDRTAPCCMSVDAKLEQRVVEHKQLLIKDLVQTLLRYKGACTKDSECTMVFRVLGRIEKARNERLECVRKMHESIRATKFE